MSWRRATQRAKKSSVSPNRCRERCSNLLATPWGVDSPGRPVAWLDLASSQRAFAEGSGGPPTTRATDGTDAWGAEFFHYECFPKTSRPTARNGTIRKIAMAK